MFIEPTSRRDMPDITFTANGGEAPGYLAEPAAGQGPWRRRAAGVVGP